MTTYSVTLTPSVTVMVTMFGPLSQVGDDSFAITTPSKSTTITADGSSVVAVILLVALVVDAAYSRTSLSKLGVKVNAPIVNADNELLTTLFL